MADKSRGRSNDPVWASRPSFAKIRIDAAWRRAAEPGHGGKDPLADAPLIPIRRSSHRNSWSGRFSHLPVGGLRDVVDFSQTRSESSRDPPVFKLCFFLCESQTRLPLGLSVRTQRASCDSTATLRHCACDTATLRCDCELNPATGALVRLHSSVPVLLYSLPSSERHGAVTSPPLCVFFHSSPPIPCYRDSARFGLATSTRLATCFVLS